MREQTRMIFPFLFATYSLFSFTLILNARDDLQKSNLNEDGLFIHRIEFVGNSAGSDKKLRKASLAIEEGKIFSQSALQRTIKEINKLRLFEEISEKDCSVRKSSSLAASVDIVILLKPREK